MNTSDSTIFLSVKETPLEPAPGYLVQVFVDDKPVVINQEIT